MEPGAVVCHGRFGRVTRNPTPAADDCDIAGGAAPSRERCEPGTSRTTAPVQATFVNDTLPEEKAAVRAMLERHFSGDVEGAAALHQRLLPLIRALFAVTSPIPLKAAVGRFGFSVGTCRLPLVELTSDQQRALDVAIDPWVRSVGAAAARASA